MILYQVQLEVIDSPSNRFYPTNFPEIGASVYPYFNGDKWLNACLVESSQSVANRLEEAILENGELIPDFRGMPYLAVKKGESILTTTLKEPHRLNSFYLGDFWIRSEMEEVREGLPQNKTNLIRWMFNHDPNSLIHGVLLNRFKIGNTDLGIGSVPISRVLKGVIEALDVREADSMIVVKDPVKSSKTAEEKNMSSQEKKDSGIWGKGNSMHAKIEYTAAQIIASFSINDQAIERMPLEDAQKQFLLDLSMFKIRKFLTDGLDLRTGCYFGVKEDSEGLPSLGELQGRVSTAIRQFGWDEMGVSPSFIETDKE